MIEVENKKQFDDIVSKSKDYVLFAFYTESSARSKEALEVLKEFASHNKSVEFYSINVGQVRDIHKAYEINSVPAVLVFKEGRKINIIYGLQDKEYYENLFVEYAAPSSETGKKVNRIVVYTSDGCPWCSRAKTYLREQGQAFREVNVSKKPAEADKLVKKTGQTGTPQININGHFVVGFDQSKIDSLLGLS